MEKNLNLGAGKDIVDGYINHDIVELPGIDIVHDLNVFPWPWEGWLFLQYISNGYSRTFG